MDIRAGVSLGAILLTASYLSGATSVADAQAAQQVGAEQIAAAEGATPGVPGRVYSPDFFERFAPQTAADMVNNLPGFTIDSGERKRGFGQGGGNVLINGRRVSGKSNSAIEELGNISASQVLRIEILDGASLNLPGLSGQVANVVKQTDAMTGNWQYNPQFRTDAKPVIDRGRVSINGEVGAFNYTLGLRVNGGNGHGEGANTVTNGDGTIREVGIGGGSGGGREYRLNGGLTYLGMAGDVLNLNFAAARPDFANNGFRLYSAPGQSPDRAEAESYTSTGAYREIGADYEFDLGPGRLKVIGLQIWDDGDDEGAFIAYDLTSGGIDGTRFSSLSERGESILRGEYSLPEFLGGDWQLATEGAFNFLERDSNLFDRLSDGSFGNRTFLANRRVEEKRFEASLSYNRNLMEGLDLQANIATEYSELTRIDLADTPEPDATREFVRPKGSLSLAWKALPDLDLNLRLSRKVGQLDFGDFIASTELRTGNQNQNNDDLVPEQSWVVEVEASRRLGPWGALTLKMEAEKVEDIVDQVLVLDVDGVTILGETVGNIDSAERFGVGLTGTINLDPIGVKGAKVDLGFELNENRLQDPLTGQDRRVSVTDLFNMELNYRHDLPSTDWAYGAFYEQRWRERSYRINETGQDIVAPGFAGVFVENKDVYGMTARLTIGNLVNSHEDFRRIVFLGDRTGPVDYTEYTSNTFANPINFRISGTF